MWAAAKREIKLGERTQHMQGCASWCQHVNKAKLSSAASRGNNNYLNLIILYEKLIFSERSLDCVVSLLWATVKQHNNKKITISKCQYQPPLSKSPLTEHVFFFYNTYFFLFLFFDDIPIFSPSPFQDSLPHIVLLGSSGGQTAAIGLLGSLDQMEKDGLRDSVLYLGRMSSSAW